MNTQIERLLEGVRGGRKPLKVPDTTNCAIYLTANNQELWSPISPGTDLGTVASMEADRRPMTEVVAAAGSRGEEGSLDSSPVGRRGRWGPARPYRSEEADPCSRCRVGVASRGEARCPRGSCFDIRQDIGRPRVGGRPGVGSGRRSCYGEEGIRLKGQTKPLQMVQILNNVKHDYNIFVTTSTETI